MTEERELWQLHYVNGSIRDLVAQREFCSCPAVREEGQRFKEWVESQMSRWMKLHPLVTEGGWEMVRQDSPKFFLLNNPEAQTDLAGRPAPQ